MTRREDSLTLVAMNFLHATCISLNGRAVLIRGPSGAGKSDLALRMIDAGATLVADDYVDMRKKDGKLFASPPEKIAGKLEVRGVGLVQLPFQSNVIVSLIVQLSPRNDIARLPNLNITDMEGVSIPTILIDAQDVSAAAKVKIALDYFLQPVEVTKQRRKDAG